MIAPLDPTQQNLQALWDQRVIKSLALKSVPVMSAEHKRLLSESDKAGLKLNASTATAWLINAPDPQVVVIVAVNVSDEEAVQQAVLMPEYAVLLPHNITPERYPFGPWFALCGTNWAASKLRDQLMVMRVWQI